MIPLGLAGLGTGCTTGEDAPWTTPEYAAKPVPRPALADGVFPMAEPGVAEAPVPERFHRELPPSVEAFKRTWSEYPSSHIKKRLCSAQPEMIDRLERAVSTAAASEEPAEDLRSTYGTLLEWCGRSESCRWAREAVVDGGPLAEVAWVALAQCGNEVEPLFERPDAPAETVIDFWSDRSWQDDFEPRFVPAVAAALGRVARGGNTLATRRAAMFLARSDDPLSARTLLGLYDELPEGAMRDELVAAMGDLSDPRAQRLFDEYCARPDESDPVCGSDWDDLEEAASPEPDSDCLAGAALREALSGDDPEAEFEVAGCLTRLAARDRPAAVAAAGTLLSWETGGAPLRELASYLVAFPEPGQLEARLEGLGLLPAAAQGGDPGLLTPHEILLASGSVHCFDVETGTFPNEHDGLLYDLAHLAGAPLAEAAFEEEAPPLDLGAGTWLVAGREVSELPAGVEQGDPYRLRAYLGGRSYSVEAQDFGDWYDLDQVLGLLNAVAADRGAEVRFTALATGDQTACVLAAPREAILAGIEEGLLEVAAPGAAMSQGKAFEEAVLERLRSGDLQLD